MVIGECHDEDGLFPGDASSFSECGADMCDMLRPIDVFWPAGVPKPEIFPCGATKFFLKCAKCFSSVRNIPSFVNGFGSTSFMPEYC